MKEKHLLGNKTGILGGGQLGLMMAQAASDWHLAPTFLDPDPQAPVIPYGKVVQGDFRDYETVMAFGKDKDLISFEIESVNLQALKDLEKLGIKVFPQASVLEIIQNKWKQKEFLAQNGFPTLPFQAFEPGALKENLIFLPAFWKQNEGGYDGKGVKRVTSQQDLESLPSYPGFLEKAVEVGKEIAVLVSRNENKEISLFPLVEQVFHPDANLVSYLQTPADVSAEVRKECEEMACQIIEKLDMVGLLAVEFFVEFSGKVWVNEMAPRPHNSGHHSIEAFQTSQFGQYWRAILNLPPGPTNPLFPYSAMVNLVGEPSYYGTPVYQGLSACLSLPGVYIHLYGKTETRPFRKMGHITVVAQTFAELDQKVSFVQNHLKVIS